MAALPAAGEYPDIDRALFAELCRICREGHLNELRQALYYEKDVLGYFLVRTQKGGTLLHEAVECAQADVTQMLLLHGVSPNVRARGGLTPLHIAASKGHVGCVTALLEAGADLSLRDDFGHDAAAKAERSKKRDQVLRLLHSREVVYLAEQGEIRLLEKRLSTPARGPEIRDLEQALLAAIHNTHDEAIPLLVVAGARRLDCALYLAIQLERVKAIAVLLLCKATITGDFQAIHSLLSEPPDTDNMPWYMPDVHRILTQGGIKMSYPIAVSIMETNYEATKELLLRTDLDMRRKQVDWSRLKLTLLHASWVYSIAPWVVSLKLGNNHLHRLPQELLSATQLRRLDLSSNLLSAVPPELFAMPNIENLMLNRNRLREIPETPDWAPSLLDLDLSENQLTTLPLGIQHSKVEILHLSKNQFTTVPKCLCRIRTLTLLDLSHMPITTLPREMENLDHLVNLNVTNSNIADLQGGGDLRGTIKAFFKARARSSKTCHIIKLVVFCQSDTAKAVMYSRLKQQPGATALPDFEIFQWNSRPLFTKKLFNAPKLFFNTWMMAGHTECISIFPCFFSDSALYVIAYDIMQPGEMREQIKPYLDNLVHFVPLANVLIIAIVPDSSEAWVDSNSENYGKRLLAFFGRPAYASLQYHGLLLVASGAKEPQPDIRQKIYDLASTMVVHGQPVSGKTYPENYFHLLPLLEKEQNTFASRRKPGVLEERALWALFDRTLSSDPPDKMELPVIVSFLKETGFLLHYDDPNERLDQFYFTRPEWLYETLYGVVRHALSRDSSLILSRGELCSLASTDGSREFGSALVRLMVRFGIALPIRPSHFLLPSLLPRCHLSSSQVSVGTLRRQFAPKTRALPVDVWPRLLCRVLASLPVLIQPPPAPNSPEGGAPGSPEGEGLGTDDETDARAEDAEDELFSPAKPTSTFLKWNGSSVAEEVCPLPSEVVCQPSPSPRLASKLRSPQKAASESNLVDRLSPVRQAPPPSSRPKNIPLVPMPIPDKKGSPLSPMDYTPRLVSEDPLRSASFPSSVRPRLGQGAGKQRSMSQVEPASLRRGLQVWNCGLIHQRVGCHFSLYPCHCEMSFVEERGIEICVPRTPTGRALLARLSRLVQKLFEERYPELFSHENLLHRHELTQLALCPDCIENGERNPTSFLVEACVHALRDQAAHNCRYHATAVPLRDLIPDYLLVDFPPDLALSSSSFQYCESRHVHRSRQTSLHQGSFHGNNITVKVYHHLDGKSLTFPLSYLRQETDFLLQLDHPNIVRMLGFCLQPPCLLLELAPLSSLYYKLMDSEQKISRSIRFYISCQVASALQYLHARSIIYRTLKSASVLVWSLEFADEVSVKLANLDRAERMSASGLVGRTGFASYPAPEMIRYSFQEEYTEKVDIYSFGILLYELVTRWQPFSDAHKPDRVPHSQRPKLAGVNASGYVTLIKLMQECWQEDMLLRPAAVELVSQISQPAFHCHVATQVLRDCLAVRGCCFVPSVRQIWVYGEYNKQTSGTEATLEGTEGTQIFILNAENLTVQGSLELKERASSIFTVDSKVWVGMTEACVHAYDTTTFRFTDRFYLEDSVTAIAVNETYAFVAQASGHLTFYSKLQFPKSCQTLEVGHQPIISMISVGDDLWLSCGNEIVMVSADDQVSIERRWAACEEEDQVYALVLSEDGNIVWSLVRGSLSISSWKVGTGDRIAVSDLSGDLMVVCCELNYDPSYLRLVSLECVGDTLWLGLTCGVIVVLSAATQPRIVCHFRAHKKATRCLLVVPDQDTPTNPTILSGGFGEVSSLATASSLQNGVIMSWQVLAADEFSLLSQRYQRYLRDTP